MKRRGSWKFCSGPQMISEGNPYLSVSRWPAQLLSPSRSTDSVTFPWVLQFYIVGMLHIIDIEELKDLAFAEVRKRVALLCSLGWPPSSLCVHEWGEYTKRPRRAEKFCSQKAEALA